MINPVTTGATEPFSPTEPLKLRRLVAVIKHKDAKHRGEMWYTGYPETTAVYTVILCYKSSMVQRATEHAE